MTRIVQILILALMIIGMPIHLSAMSASPDIMEIQANPGQKVTGVVTVETEQAGVDISVQPFTIDAKGNSRSDDTAPRNLSWIKTVSSVKKTKKNGGKLTIPYEILVTSNTQAEYTAKLVVTEQLESKPGKTESGIMIGLAFGIPIYVSVPALETHAMAIDSFTYLKDTKQTKLVLRNDGSVQDRPVVTYSLYKYGGLWPFVSRDKVSSGDITRSWPILGKMSREFLTAMTLTPGDYEIELIVNYGMRYGFNGNIQQTIAFSVR